MAVQLCGFVRDAEEGEHRDHDQHVGPRGGDLAYLHEARRAGRAACTQSDLGTRGVPGARSAAGLGARGGVSGIGGVSVSKQACAEEQ
ncbi:hypothetical protein [Arthrobacter sp. SLBN-122]|uniref:hypothetical protein n=1 Tax=Arthrobacter sp. SLBN-122 TaxID=2768455 RepID=UPI003FA4246B